jgi:hypothetical protein
VQPGLDHFFAKRFQRLAGGNHLHQHIGAISIGLHHFFNGFDLAFDAAQADDERSLFQPGTDMFGFHAKDLTFFMASTTSKNGA